MKWNKKILVLHCELLVPKISVERLCDMRSSTIQGISTNRRPRNGHGWSNGIIDLTAIYGNGLTISFKECNEINPDIKYAFFN